MLQVTYIFISMYCEILFFVFNTGRRMISIIRSSKNVDQKRLSKKVQVVINVIIFYFTSMHTHTPHTQISSFVIFYMILDCTAAVIRLTNLLGNVVSLMVVHILIGIIILFTFVIFPIEILIISLIKYY